MKPQRLLLWLVVLLAATSAAAQGRTAPPAPAGAPSVSLFVQPTTVMVPHDQTQADIHVRVQISNESALPFIVRSRPLPQGQSYAPVSFGQENTDFVEIDDQRPPREVKSSLLLPVHINNLTASGASEAIVDATSLATGETLATAKISVLKLGSGFDPEITSEHLKNNQLELQGEPGQQFVIHVANPQDAATRTFWLSIEPSGVLSVSPQELTLQGGQAEQAFVQLDGNVPPKSAHHVLRVTAKDDTKLFETTLIHVTDASVAKERLLLLFGIVLTGAGISLIINNVFPVTSTKSRHRMTLAQLEAQIRGASRVSASLRSALLQEATRGRLLNANLSWYNASKNEDMEVIQRVLDTLQRRVDAVETIGASRLTAEQANLLPITARYEIEELLRRAEEAVADGHLDAAIAHVAKAAERRDQSTAPPAQDELRQALEKKIKDLLGRQPAQKRDERASALLVQLRDALPRIKDMAPSTLLETERDYNALYTYIETGESALMRNPGDVAIADTVSTFLGLLTANPLAPSVVWLRELLDSDLSLKAVEDSVNEGAGQIVCNRTPRTLELNDYRFEFTDPRIAVVPGVAQLASFEWDFKDGTDTTEPRVSQRKHSYEKKMARRYCWQAWRPTEVTITVKVTAPLSQVSKQHSCTLHTRPARDAGWGVFGMHALRFGVTSLVGVCAAFGSQYAVAPDDVTISTYVTAFLFGFSLDQVRSKTTPS